MSKFSRADVRSILGDAHTEEMENRLVALHLGVVDPLKDQLQAYKADAEKLQAVQKELDNLKAGDGDYKAKYEAEAKAYSEYKKQVEAEKESARNDADVLAICKEAGIVRESSLRLVAKDFDRSKIKRGEDGSITNRDELLAAVKADYADFVASPGAAGAPPANPPTGGGSGMTKEQIMGIEDDKARQQAIAENIEMFNRK